ncbi:MAG: neutral zinc metallopeptidase [Thermomicrobiales bacterium]
MRRCIALFLAICLLCAHLAWSPASTFASDSQDAADTAYYLSELEANGQFNALYDLIHPDAHAMIPRAAVIGWYQNEFAPRGASPATISGVRFVTWTWAVTGKTYHRTAEVSFVQTFWDGGANTALEDVVRLVKTDGEWRWFFGRSREFIKEQIALYVPQSIAGGTLADLAVADIDAYWQGLFAATAVGYESPDVIAFVGATPTGCGYAADQGFALYCSLDQTIYYDIGWYEVIVLEVGDFAWVNVLAHEWGHHVQHILQVNGVSNPRGRPPIQEELQADCLAGAYALDAETRGLLDVGDVFEAVTLAALSGSTDHGTGDDRLTAFMSGYLGGLVGCGLTL